MTRSPFLEMVREEMRLRGYSLRAEKTYLFWIKQFILFHRKRPPSEIAGTEVKNFRPWRGDKRDVAINTQKVALNAVVLLYHKVKVRIQLFLLLANCTTVDTREAVAL